MLFSYRAFQTSVVGYNDRVDCCTCFTSPRLDDSKLEREKKREVSRYGRFSISIFCSSSKDLIQAATVEKHDQWSRATVTH
jgi:hypothetical protein